MRTVGLFCIILLTGLAAGFEGNLTKEVRQVDGDAPVTMRQAEMTSNGVRQVYPASLVGYYAWTWPYTPTPGLYSATMSVAFSGFTNARTALDRSKKVYRTLKGDKYIAFGGGTEPGRFTRAGIASINAVISGGLLSGYSGIVYDVEAGDSGLRGDFARSFALAKSYDFSVVVTVSHSAPYGIEDAGTLMDSFLSSRNIDYISPQLYTGGTEFSNDYSISSGYGWYKYQNSYPRVVVSIVQARLYDDAFKYFRNIRIPLSGYIQWAQ